MLGPTMLMLTVVNMVYSSAQSRDTRLTIPTRGGEACRAFDVGILPISKVHTLMVLAKGLGASGFRSLHKSKMWLNDHIQPPGTDEAVGSWE